MPVSINATSVVVRNKETANGESVCELTQIFRAEFDRAEDMKNSLNPSHSQRRKNPRIPFSLDVDWGETRACVETGRVTSLSIQGCFIETPLEVAEGKPLFIRLLLAPGRPRGTAGLVSGQVLYHLPKQGIGVNFKKLPAGYGKHIEDLVEFYLSSQEDG